MISIFLIAAPLTLFSQNYLADQYERAELLFLNRNYFDAITEYKRLLFFDGDKTHLYQANYMIGQCYKNGAKWDDAVKYFKIAGLSTSDNGEIYDAEIEIVRVNILRKTSYQALTILDHLESNPVYTDKNNEINYWRGWAYIFADEWEKAAESFGYIDNEHQLKKYCEQVTDDKYSITFARLISYILPGSGEVYTGHYFEGLISLGWNVLWGYLSVNAFIQDRTLDGILISSLLWLRFYRGGIQSGEKSAEDENLKITNAALKFLQMHYRGIKP